MYTKHVSIIIITQCTYTLLCTLGMQSSALDCVSDDGSSLRVT